MEVIEFKAKISISFSTNIQLDQVQGLLRRTIELPCQAFQVEYKKSPFVYHPDEAAEAAGFYQNGIAYEIQRTLARKQSYYNFSKLFEAITGILNAMKEPFDHVEFELL